MKNSEIHQGLENAYLRDYFAISVMKNFEKEYSTKLEHVCFDIENPWESTILKTEKTIEYEKKRLEIFKERQALFCLIKAQGWKEHDVSDETEKDLDGWLNFVGTEEEYDVFIESLKKA